MALAYVPVIGGAARRLAAIGMPPLYGAVPLAALHPRGYVSPRARLAHPNVHFGRGCFVGDGVLIFQDRKGADVRLGDRMHLHESCTIQTGQGGRVIIGAETHVQPRCQFSAYCGAIEIGERVEIAPNCAFYPYNHGMRVGTPIRQQPLYSRCGIAVGDDAWLGYGVVLLDGARVGEGAVVAAGSVVTGEIPANAIAGGVPAKVLGCRPA